MRQAVELMAMDDQVRLPIGRPVLGPLSQTNCSKIHPDELLEEFVMVPDNQSDRGMFAMLSQQLLDEDSVITQSNTSDDAVASRQ